ncbi:MAG: alanine racemase [Clostridia bacterium]|nr:alanine racemase [Clostridia bacterium]MDD4666288.1 alanine racemase [Clostridia bacterium]
MDYEIGVSRRGLFHPVWAEVDLGKIVHNYREVRRLVGAQVKIMAVVKANAYGHGAVEVARALSQAGADCFGVANMQEAVQLRTAGIEEPVLILGWLPPEDYEQALLWKITLAIFSLEEAEKLSRTAMARGEKALVHLKIDTGMGRIGFCPDAQSLSRIKRILVLPGLEVEGIFSHLAQADERDKTYTKQQLQLFKGFVERLETETGFKFKTKHCANSAAVIDHPEAYFDLVRPGIILYGLKPSAEVHLERLRLRQAMALRARISFVKKVPAGTAISYGGSYVTTEESIIATLPLGYADGYSRLLSGKAEVLCQGERAPLVGRICMDQLMFEATALKNEVQKGDLVTLWGQDGAAFISVDELAEILGTINYEVICALAQRVPRIFV